LGRAADRLTAHRTFVSRRMTALRPPGHHNRPHDTPVVTAQETDLEVRTPVRVRETAQGMEVVLERPAAASG
ncbi:MAG: hypothetical protein JXB39_02485, partial [Deltaproteobacteria bacterium]|nr:hypothetical protein [Deltaproteobacteria bacterium]